jgi:N-acetyl-anhydromuramyl-L-alanine amidase AmpD
MTLNELNIKQVQFPETQYIKEEHPKKQIYLHHTAGNASGENVFKYWAGNKERVATCVSISGPGDVDGLIVQGFSSKHWAFHLGLKESTFNRFGVPYQSLDKISIGIEICNWGQLTAKDGKFLNYVGKPVPEDQICILDKPFKGHKYFHNYSDAQIESTRKLLLLWKERYGIPLTYKESIWDISKDALSGVPGVYTHNSVRTDKVDVYPHPKLIQMLKSL